MKLLLRNIALPFLFAIIPISEIVASHIRAGEIIAENINNSPLSWQFTLILFTDLSSDVQSEAVDFDFGDGTPGVNVPRVSFLDLGNGTAENTYVVNHTFNSAIGARFVVSATEENRNACIINFDNSVNTPFHVSTEIILDAAVGINATPRFTQIPVVNADFGQRWVFDNGGFDPDVNDSVSYEWTIPKLSPGTNVLNYRDPDIVAGGLTEDGSAQAFIDLDPATGVLVWDAPNLLGCFNIAFNIVEWKQNPFTGEYLKRSVVTRDMQIIVRDFDNLRPLISAPADTCVVAGTTLRLIAVAVDQNTPPDFIYLSASGEPFEVAQSPATFSPDPDDSVSSPGALNFQWDTRCVHVRQKPYRVVFRVDDARPILEQLTDFAETNIKVIGPAPQLDTAILENENIRLRWSPYFCSNAESMKIFRRKGDFPYQLDSCFTGAPSGFVEIGEVSINTLEFLDDNNGAGLEKGPKYCYVLVAEFPDGALSRPSNEKCNSLPIDIPLITNVDVELTATNGRINVKWTRPLELDSVINPPPYRYDLFGNNQSNLLFFSNNLLDTSFVWNGPVTEDFQNKAILHFTSNGNIFQDSVSASSVLLTSTPGGQRVQLEWSADVPWSNNGQYHLIYKRNNNSGVFELLDSIFADGDNYSYLDQGQANGIPLIDGEEYCYFVETRGSYYNDVYSQVFSNRSQISCDIPQDSIPPCPPILSLEVPDCDSLLADKECSGVLADLPNSNLLKWTPDFSEGCDRDIAEYRIYYKSSTDGEYQLLSTVLYDTLIFEHGIEGDLSGCYVVTAVDSFDNESAFSNEVCRDNCIYFELPNVFTPNNDEWNNTFIPCPEPRFVKSIEFEVYNRWGRPLKIINDDLMINWDGLDESGNEVPAGYYFYKADVEFFRLNPEDSKKTFKGWIWLAR